jgi:hypothetical protein
LNEYSLLTCRCISIIVNKSMIRRIL